ncbi:MAG: hypothetical protein ACM359_03790 [Bacillota bacterium]
MSEVHTDNTGGAAGAEGIGSPPAAAMPARQEVDPSARLHEMARELMRARNRRLLMEYLRLRRSLR